MTARYQYGSFRIRKRAKGPAVWEFRWIQGGKPKSMLVGTVEKLPNQVDAERALEAFRSRINATNPQSKLHSLTVGGLIDRFMKKYSPRHHRKNTRISYQGAFDKHVRPRWGNELVENVKTMTVQDWLDE